MLTSKAVWIVGICQFGAIWNLVTLQALAPTYFKNIHNWNIVMAGFLSGIPNVLKMLFTYYVGTFVDYLLHRNKMTRTNARKMAGAIATIGQSLFTLALAYSGNSRTYAIVWYTVAKIMHGAGPAGILAYQLDLSPNYAGDILGICGTLSSLTGYVAPLIAGKLTLNNVRVFFYVIFILLILFKMVFFL